MEETLANRYSCSNPITWFSPETGIYSSKQSPRELPQDPFQDLVSFLFSHEHKGVTALVDSSSGFSISYKNLHEMVEVMAAGLHQLGVMRNQLVLLLLPNTILYPIIYLGVLSIGAVVTTMNPLSSREEIEKHMGHHELALAFAFRENTHKLRGLRTRVVAVPEDPSSSSQEFSLFHRLVSSDPQQAPKPIIRQRDVAALQFSSGTSGQSKGVVITHQNLISMVELFVRFEASQYDREGWQNVYLAAIPMFHVYGLSLFSMGLLSLGSTVVVMQRFNADEALKAIDKFNVTHFPVVPPIMMALVKAKGVSSGCGTPSLTQISSGAAPLSEKIIHEFLKAFPHVDVIQGYGLTESTAVGTRGFNTENHKRYTSVGLLAPNMQAKVVDSETGSYMPPGSSGELWLRGPAIMQGYLDDEAATSLAIDKDGWLRTGDIAHFDEDGYLYILDRLKDTIKYKGFQIAPADLEAILITHPEVLDAAVTSAEDEAAGEIPVAYVVRVMGSLLTSEEVITYVAKKVAPYKKVRKVVFVNSIPRSPAGKILRRLLRNNQRISKL